MDEVERTLLVKNEVFVFKIPPRASAKGYRAADWKLDAPDFTGRLRVLEKSTKCEIRIEDRSSGQLFAACPVEHYPGVSVEPVTDSSRYFVICIQDSGRKAYIGIGFSDRSDSFDLNVTLQDHFKQLKKETQFTKEATEPPKPNLDLAFKEGQTIRINIPNKAAGAPAKTKTKTGLGGVLPPPPSGVGNIARLPNSVSGGSLTSVVANPTSNSAATVDDLLGDFDPVPANTTTDRNPSQPASSSFSDFDDWGDFAAASKPSTQTVASGNWEQF